MRTISAAMAVLFFSCSPAFAAELIKDGFYNEYDKQGHLHRIVEYQLGQLNGHFRTFYADGRLDGTGSYLNGQLEGMALAFYPDGVMKLKAFYHEGKLQGPSTLYYKNGKVQAEVDYVKGMQDGVTKENDVFGHPTWIRHFVWGKEQGISQEFYSDSGAVHFEYEYDKGVQNGLIREYHTNGQIKGAYQGRDGIKEGTGVNFIPPASWPARASSKTAFGRAWSPIITPTARS